MLMKRHQLDKEGKSKATGGTRGARAEGEYTGGEMRGKSNGRGWNRFPELEATTLGAFRPFQVNNGEIPSSFETPTSMRDPRYTCQRPLNSGQ